MGYNHASAEKDFNEQWKKAEKKYRQLGMTEEHIKELYKFERETFNSNRRFYENTVELSDGNAYNGTQTNSIVPIDLERNWTEYIKDEEKYKEVMKCSLCMRKAYFMNKIQGYSHQEISSILMKSRQTITYWISKIAEILK